MQQRLFPFPGRRLRDLLLLLALLFWPAALPALEVPPLEGRVNDYAGMLSQGAVRQLEHILQQLETSDSTQIAVLTVPSLEGDSLEDFSMRVAEQWQIGQRQRDNGAILLVAKRERKLRIEVGYGLEGRLTDLMAGRIIRNVIVPRFQAGQIDQGVVEGVQAMVQVVKGEYTASEAPTPSRGNGSGHGSGHGLFGLVLALFILNVLGRLRRSLGAAAGAVIVPIIGTAVFGFSLMLLLVLIPAGIAAGLLASLLGSPLVFGHTGHRAGRGGFWIGGSGGGLGGGGFGGFSGGGGGFGGGGASGGW